jgi:hypothetical protein
MIAEYRSTTAVDVGATDASAAVAIVQPTPPAPEQWATKPSAEQWSTKPSAWNPPPNVTITTKSTTKTAQVEAAAEEYLTQKGRRATSGELLPAVVAKGIVVTGKTPSKTLASYLSTSKRFDNVPGFGGYGLVEWNGRRTAPVQAQAHGLDAGGPGTSPASATSGLFS